MITVDLFKNEQGLITGYKVSGHAGFAAAGEDIVCGAVSVLTQTPILGLEQHLKCQPSYHVDEVPGAGAAVGAVAPEGPGAAAAASRAVFERGVAAVGREGDGGIADLAQGGPLVLVAGKDGCEGIGRVGPGKAGIGLDGGVEGGGARVPGAARSNRR